MSVEIITFKKLGFFSRLLGLFFLLKYSFRRAMLQLEFGESKPEESQSEQCITETRKAASCSSETLESNAGSGPAAAGCPVSNPDNLWKSPPLPELVFFNLVRALTFRINRVCSPAVVQEELDTLRTILTRNGYPGQILDRWVTPSSAQPERRIGPQLCPLTLRIPWLGRGTEKLVERANDAVRLAYFAGKVRAVYKTKRAFNLPKERIPTPSQSNLIYLFECRCNRVEVIPAWK